MCSNRATPAGFAVFLRALLLVIPLLACWPSVQAQPTTLQELEPDTIVVTGRRPGPRMWKVGKEDHVLWIFGLLTPLPRRMEWDSSRVAEVLLAADEYLSSENADWSPQVPKALRVNPDKQRLEGVLPADSWSHYIDFVRENFGRDKDVETLRPMLAISTMQSLMYSRHDLVHAGRVMNEINALARQNRGLKRTSVDFRLPEDLKIALDARFIAALSSLTLEQETACFDAGLDRVMPNINLNKLSANAWANGEIAELDYLMSLRSKEVNRLSLDDDPEDPCTFFLLDEVLRQGTNAFQAEVEERWLAEIDRALNENGSTFMVLGMQELFREDGVLQRLRERGYEVRVPE